jgi:predicted RNase H-like HicB family nuclease
MNFTLACEQEEDGRWIAVVPDIPDVLADESSTADAMAEAEILAPRVMADHLEGSEFELVSISLSPPISA